MSYEYEFYEILENQGNIFTLLLKLTLRNTFLILPKFFHKTTISNDITSYF